MIKLDLRKNIQTFKHQSELLNVTVTKLSSKDFEVALVSQEFNLKKIHKVISNDKKSDLSKVVNDLITAPPMGIILLLWNKNETTH